MFSNVVVKSVSAIRKELHYVTLISKILYILTFYMFNKRVHLLVKRILTQIKLSLKEQNSGSEYKGRFEYW